MTASRHSRGNGIGEADGTRRRLGFLRCNDLQHIGPFEVVIGIDGLRVIRAGRGDNEPVVCMDKPGLVNGMVSGARTPCGMTSRGSVVCMIGDVSGWS